MPWTVVSPAAVGLSEQLLDNARDFINDQIKQRQCFLIIKNGKIAYEWYNPQAVDVPLAPVWHGAPQNKPHHGYSMTKTAGGFLLLLAATHGGLDLDADITQKYGVPSPKPYAITVRQMMAQVIGGDDRPGEKWRYDELGTMYLHLFPQIIEKATGKKASAWLDQLRQSIGLTSVFQWPEVDSKWFRGAEGSCRDWARFGQLILNGGSWSNNGNMETVIASQYIQQMQEPVKMPGDKEYSNPCYGLLIWLNADKSKHPGCCWEASRLPEPKCGENSFMDGAVTDMTLNIGLYGQVVMTLPSVNTVVVGFGNDLRPIEPARIGYYPGVCKALGIPCNTPPPVPQTKCGEHLECTGVSAQCFSGGAWSHAEPEPGKQQCVSCFQDRLPYYDKAFPEAHYMVNDWCPGKQSIAFDYIKCFCGLTGVNANPFHPWSVHPPALGNNQSQLMHANNAEKLLMV
jgi:CubicO group peptidase (beta-lactamase class C family)